MVFQVASILYAWFFVENNTEEGKKGEERQYTLYNLTYVGKKVASNSTVLSTIVATPGQGHSTVALQVRGWVVDRLAADPHNKYSCVNELQKIQPFWGLE